MSSSEPGTAVSGSNGPDRILTAEMVAEIESHFDRYPSRQAVTLPALHIVQERLRHVPLQAVVEIAELLDLKPADIQDTLTFYGFFKQDQPHGETRAWVCRSISCALLGADQIREHLSARTGLKPGETTADGKLTIEVAECLGACEFAPCMLAGKTLYKRLTTEQVDEFLESLEQPHGA
ncbi:MAG: NAD(P)H-dependent oxidoreductase subunit E [Pirellulaceae bacterium]